MKKTIILIFTAFALMATWAQASERPVRIAIEGQYPPFNYIDQEGTARGFEVDLVKTLCGMIGRECQFVVLDWDGIIPALLARKVDAVAASMSITEERKKSVAFTRKYYEERGSFVIRKDSGLVISKEGLEGKRIGVQRATTWNAYVENTYPDAEILFYEDDNRGCLDLLAGRIDTYLAQSYFMSQWVKKPEAEPLEIAGEPVDDKRYIGEGIGIALRKEDTVLKQKLDEALDSILKNGAYKEIAARYFDFDVYGFEK